jgi:hypothetical protein
METPNLLDVTIATIGRTIGDSPAITLIVIIGLVIAFFIIRNQLAAPPRLDLTRHMERPPIEHQPPRSLPPGEKYVEWEAGKDKEKDAVPWRR